VSNYDYLGIKRSNQKAYKDAIRERDNFTCQICGSPGYDVDHIIPFYLSHDSSPSNLRVLCHRCNLIGRRYTLPKGRMRRIPVDEYEDYIRRELAISAKELSN